MSEKRREKRLGRRIVARLEMDGQEPRPAVISDVSGHGMRIRTPRGGPGGCRVKLRLEPGTPRELQVEGEVRWSRGESERDSVELGLRLDAAPADFFDLLLALPPGGLAERLQDLNAMPTLILDLMALVNDPSASVRHIEGRIKRDQAMTAYLLKSVNSAYYGLAQPAASIRQALQVAGFATLKSLLLSYFTRQLTYLAGDRPTQQRLWRHSLVVALLAREAGRAAGVDEEAAFTAGLLHDIGKAVLLAAEPTLYLPVLQEATRVAGSSMQVEGRLLGYSHVEAGLYVMEKWNFSELQRQAVRFHHLPLAYEGGEVTVPIVAWANQLIHHHEGRMPDAAELCPLPPGLGAVSPAALLEKALQQVEPLS